MHPFMEEDGKVRERAYERLYSLYVQLVTAYISRSSRFNGLENVSPERFQEEIKAFASVENYDYHGILSDTNRAEIIALETALFGRSPMWDKNRPKTG